MNQVAFFEIQADNPVKIAKFYEAIFGWKFVKEEGLPIEYWRIHTDGMFGGLLKRPAPAPAPMSGTNAYVCSMEVTNFDETAADITKLGGQIALPKFAVTGKCWQGYFIDPEGNTFGIFEVDETAK